jgi:hypothetical protein
MTTFYRGQKITIGTHFVLFPYSIETGVRVLGYPSRSDLESVHPFTRCEGLGRRFVP